MNMRILQDIKDESSQDASLRRYTTTTLFLILN